MAEPLRAVFQGGYAVPAQACGENLPGYTYTLKLALTPTGTYPPLAKLALRLKQLRYRDKPAGGIALCGASYGQDGVGAQVLITGHGEEKNVLPPGQTLARSLTFRLPRQAPAKLAMDIYGITEKPFGKFLIGHAQLRINDKGAIVLQRFKAFPIQ